ncbi:hypothetical protein HYQ46_010865 [Verticillium longisporum]|nr:hypothetical protein HYQ46_010865 [Verticillium longisporum]
MRRLPRKLLNVKVEAADVALLVEELEVTKPRATELLKANEGDAVRAMRAGVEGRGKRYEDGTCSTTSLR